MNSIDMLEYDKEFAKTREEFRKKFGNTYLFDEFCQRLIKKIVDEITKNVYGLEPRKESNDNRN